MTIKTAGDAAAAIAKAMEQYQAGKVPYSPEEVAAWREKLQQQIRLGVAQLPPPQRGARSGGGRGPGVQTVTGGAGAAQGAGGSTHSATALKGNALRTEVKQDGQSVGQLSAQLNTELLFGTLLRMTPRDREESRSRSAPTAGFTRRARPTARRSNR